jgi:predicted porin
MTPKRWHALRTSGAIHTASDVEVGRDDPFHSLTLENFSMKKTLIALAAVAVTGAAFAQSNVTLSGKLRFAYENLDKKTVNATPASKQQGLRVTDGDFRLTATEDLGGGLRATAYMEVSSRGRDHTPSGRDAGITLSGGFGSVFIGAIEAANGIEPLASAGAPVYGDLDANNFGYTVISGAGNVDMLRYTTPTMNGFNAYFSILDATGAGGSQSTSTTQDISQVGFNYAAGALRVAGDYAKWGKNGVTSTAVQKNRTRISGNYNLGVATVGAGYEVVSLRNGLDDKSTMFGVSVPLGAITVGATMAEGKLEGAQKRTGYELGAKYDLSKRTYVGVHYLSSKDKSATTPGTDTKFRVQLAHSF